jgi:hypothetical protein
MSDGRFVRFDRKEDNVGQIISANDINSLQSVSEQQQRAIFQERDNAFLDKALFVLEHHRLLNGMWLDLFEDVNKIDLLKTQDVIFSEPERGITFPDATDYTEGVLYSQTYINPNGSNIKKVMVMVDAYVPEGTNLVISITNNGVDWFEVPLSNSDLFEIPTDGQKLKLEARFTRSDVNVTPRLNAWAVLFRDPQLELVELPDGSKVVIGNPQDDVGNLVNIYHRQLLGIGPDDHHPQEHSHDGLDGSGLVSHTNLIDIGEDDHHPKDHQHGVDGVSLINLGTDVEGTLSDTHLSHQVWTGKPGVTGLFFDPKIGDRLVYTKTPDDETYLFYDFTHDGRLSHSITIFRGVAVWETLQYGPYVNSRGETEIKMLGTDKKEYDANDIMVIREIEKMTAPAPVSNILVSDPELGNVLDLAWTANKEHDVIGYNVYVRAGGVGPWALANTTGLIPTTGYSVVSLTTGVAYQFYVTAVDTQGYESDPSVIVSGTPTT